MAARSLTYQELYDMTDGFDADRIVGQGSYGVVYWGVDCENRVIAVKKLHDVTPKEGDARYKREFDNLRELDHPNIVRMLGYCYHREERMEWHQGGYVRVAYIHRLLCFEFVSGSSLEEKVTDYLPTGLNWGECYKIIRGICDAIQYIEPMRHMDIKPSNILLGEDNTAKLADFGLSSVFQNEVTRTTGSSYGSPRYIPPEYRERWRRSRTFDIFSFGVIMLELAAGRRAYGNITSRTDPEQYIDEAVQRWTQQYRDSFLESHCEQLKKCIEIGLECTDTDTQNRPGIQDIINRLRETEDVASASNVSQRTNQLQRSSINYPSASTSRVVGIDNAMENLRIHDDNTTDPMAPAISFQFTHGGNSGVQVHHSWIHDGGNGIHVETQWNWTVESEEEED